MAHGIARRKEKAASGVAPRFIVGASIRPDFMERRIRQTSGWIMLCLMLLAELGLAWDRRWHDIVGRDQFWIPPHIMMYSGVAGTGLITLGIVLVDTRRYYQKKAGVDESSTTGVLRVFHAPLGFILLGCGMLIDAIAAPFDNYWHELYGIDVTFWSPFHLMGHLGAAIGGLGIIYAFASEAVQEQQAEHPSRRLLGLTGPEWAVVVLLAALMEIILPALTAFIPVVLGPVQLLSYPLILVLTASLFLVSAYHCFRKPGITLLTILILWPLSIATELFTPFALRFMAMRLGLSYRLGREPIVDVALALLPVFYLVCALMVEAAVAWQRRSGKAGNGDLRGAWLLGILMAIPAVVIPPAIVHALRLWAPGIPLTPDVIQVLQPTWLNMLLTLPLAMLLGAIMAYLGTVFGDIWHWNTQ
jgi:hypothetical protein